MKKNKQNRQQVSHSGTYTVFGAAYISFCFITLLLCGAVMNTLISKNSVNQMNETIGLIAEKVNVSFDMMRNYVEFEASILSVQSQFDFAEEYTLLQNLKNDVNYLSVGLVEKDGVLYCSQGEQKDLTKYGYDKAALAQDELYITEPYLSCVTGSNVITMFAPIYQDGAFVGDLFVTYPLEYIQELAKSTVLKHDVESYLMNGISGNYITCSNSANHTAGVWGNLNLIKNEMICSDGYDYNAWLKHMVELSEDNVLCYKMDGVSYTQAYVDIVSMQDWFVVVRIPNTELTNTMHQYLWCMGTCAVILLVGTLVLAFVLYFNESQQRKKMQMISETDPLTSLMNRRAFSLKLDGMLKNKADISDSVYIFVDIDYFKEVNDNHGHAVGDEILRNVAAIMRNIFSNHGIVARVGGDEFNIFLYTSSIAEDLIREYVSAIQKIKLSDGTDFPITCSIGMAKYRAKDNRETITARADEALYYVKRNGRNNFCWYDSVPK